jgi:7,8-dihydroneopterin aldolase/epimerase/oxygenase
MAHDKIVVSGLEFFAHGGVTEAEQGVGQRYWVHIELEVDVGQAASTDNLEDTVSYAEVAQLVVRVAGAQPFRLIENLAGRIAAAVLDEFPVERVRLEVRKLLPPIDGVVAYAAVRMNRKRQTGH